VPVPDRLQVGVQLGVLEQLPAVLHPLGACHHISARRFANSPSSASVPSSTSISMLAVAQLPQPVDDAPADAGREHDQRVRLVLVDLHRDLVGEQHQVRDAPDPLLDSAPALAQRVDARVEAVPRDVERRRP
jgi:hypothetical protein